jgi:nucleotide-binding universal stress UspA family protein
MLAIQTMLHPTDFSENSEHAFQVACMLARDCGARLIVLHVMPPPLEHEKLEARHHPEEYYGGLWKALRNLQAPDAAVTVEHQLLEGNAVAEILWFAEQTRCDMIVMGTHGRTGLPRLLMGSVAEQVLRRALCPVLTVKKPVLDKHPAAQAGAQATDAVTPTTP